LLAEREARIVDKDEVIEDLVIVAVGAAMMKQKGVAEATPKIPAEAVELIESEIRDDAIRLGRSARLSARERALLAVREGNTELGLDERLGSGTRLPVGDD